MRKDVSIDTALNDVRTLLNSDITSYKIAKSSELPISQISRIRSGKITLESIRVYNFNRLYKTACLFDVPKA